MARKYIDCRENTQGEINCSLTIAGEENEVIQAAVGHGITVHGYKDSLELRQKIKSSLKPEPLEWSSHKVERAA